MQITKTCTQCAELLSIELFGLRRNSADGHSAACRACINKRDQINYWARPEVREKYKNKSVESKRARFARDPAYHRAFRLWGNAQRRSRGRVPTWVKIVDFVPICQEALDRGSDYEVDHIFPLRGKLVSGLHVPGNIRVVLRAANQAKSNKYDPFHSKL